MNENLIRTDGKVRVRRSSRARAAKPKQTGQHRQNSEAKQKIFCVLKLKSTEVADSRKVGRA